MMKKIGFVLMVCIFLSTGLLAQKDGVAPLAKGQSQINFGIGFNSGGLPVYFAYDIALHKDVTITPEAQYAFDFNNDGGTLVLKFGADYHWNWLIGIPNNWDFYAGAEVGYRIWLSSQGEPNGFGQGSGFHFGLRIGGRWYWNERWGLQLQFGGGTGFGTKFGLCVRL